MVGQEDGLDSHFYPSLSSEPRGTSDRESLIDPIGCYQKYLSRTHSYCNGFVREATSLGAFALAWHFCPESRSSVSDSADRLQHEAGDFARPLFVVGFGVTTQFGGVA